MLRLLHKIFGPSQTEPEKENSCKEPEFKLMPTTEFTKIPSVIKSGLWAYPGTKILQTEYMIKNIEMNPRVGIVSILPAS